MNKSQQKGAILAQFFDNIHEDVIEDELFKGKLLHFKYEGRIIPIDTKRIMATEPEEFYYKLGDIVIAEVLG